MYLFSLDELYVGLDACADLMRHAFSKHRRREFSDGLVNEWLSGRTGLKEDLERWHLKYTTLLLKLSTLRTRNEA